MAKFKSKHILSEILWRLQGSPARPKDFVFWLVIDADDVIQTNRLFLTRQECIDLSFTVSGWEQKSKAGWQVLPFRLKVDEAEYLKTEIQ